MSEDLKPFVRSEGAFPLDDLMWVEVKEYLIRQGLERALLAPFEFSEFFPELDPIQFSYFKKAEEYNVVVINKGQVDRYSDSFVDAIQKNFVYAFGNAVFNVYVKGGVAQCTDATHEYKRTSVKEVVKSVAEARHGLWPFFQKIKINTILTLS